MATLINPASWPRFMRSATAASYVDEVSVGAFLRKVGSVYPTPSYGRGRTARWDREAIDRIRLTHADIKDAADVL